jgi:hypothetical protein
MLKSTGITVIALFVFFASINILSQQDDVKQKKTPEERAEIFSAKMQKKLELSDVQKQSVYDELLGTFKQRETDRELYKNDKEARRNAAKTRFEKLDAKFKDILSQEQYQKYETHKQKMKEKRKEKMRNKNKQKKAIMKG